MSLELHLSAKQLGVLVFHFNALEKEPMHSRQGKVARSILDKLILKFRKKYLDVVNLPAKTNKGKIKKYKFSIDYHDGHYLETFIDIALNFAMNEYDRNVLNFIKSNLNQQLV